MLTIRKEQMETLGAHSMQDFENRLLKQLQSDLPLETENLGEDRIRELIREGKVRAAEYDIVAERDLAQFVELMVALEPEWELAPERKWALDLLEEPELTGHLRMEMVYEKVDY